MPAEYRVSEDDGFWYVEDASTRKWWTVSYDLKHVAAASGRALAEGSRQFEAVVGAVRGQTPQWSGVMERNAR